MKKLLIVSLFIVGQAFGASQSSVAVVPSSAVVSGSNRQKYMSKSRAATQNILQNIFINFTEKDVEDLRNAFMPAVHLTLSNTSTDKGIDQIVAGLESVAEVFGSELGVNSALKAKIAVALPQIKTQFDVLIDALIAESNFPNVPGEDYIKQGLKAALKGFTEGFVAKPSIVKVSTAGSSTATVSSSAAKVGATTAQTAAVAVTA